jgi:hypothetical protein
MAGKILVRRHVGAGGRGVCHRGVAHPMGNHGSGIAFSPVGAVAVSLMVVSCCEVTRAARRRSIRACRERWPERPRRRGAEGPTTSAWVGAGASAGGVTGTGPGPVDRHEWSSSRLVMRMRSLFPVA